MAKTIKRAVLRDNGGEAMVRVPKGARFLSAALVGSRTMPELPTIWFEVDDGERAMEDRRLILVREGSPIGEATGKLLGRLDWQTGGSAHVFTPAKNGEAEPIEVA